MDARQHPLFYHGRSLFVVPYGDLEGASEQGWVVELGVHMKLRVSEMDHVGFAAGATRCKSRQPRRQPAET